MVDYKTISLICNAISILISLISLIVSGLNYKKYKELTEQYNEMVNTQTLTAQGALESQLRSAISQVTHNMAEIAEKLENNPTSNVLKSAYFAEEETYRNTYEDACAKYIDGKIDKDRFKKMYLTEIRRLVEEEPNKQYYESNQSPYYSTLKVYKEWYRQE